MPTPPRDDTDSMQFRGPTLEDAIALDAALGEAGEDVPRALALEALADRLPPEVLNERRKGIIAVDWDRVVSAQKPLNRKANVTPIRRAIKKKSRVYSRTSDFTGKSLFGLGSCHGRYGLSSGNYLHQRAPANRYAIQFFHSLWIKKI